MDQNLIENQVLNLITSISTLANQNLPVSFTKNLDQAIKSSPSNQTYQIQIRIKIIDQTNPPFNQLQTALAKIYVRAELFKAKSKKPWLDLNVLIDGWSGIHQHQSFHNPSNHPTVALGGTFDHLHAGHKILLTMAAWLANKRVIVGITDDNLLVNKKFKSELQSLSDRTKSVQSFLRLISPSSLEILTPALNDIYGPTANDPDIQAILVSRETISGANSINEIRHSKGLPKLEKYVIDVISPTDVCLQDEKELKELKISSTEIRRWLYNLRMNSEPHPTTSHTPN
ncbi:hypothetical protein CROQUDRAFT_50056 [Cronartium quercuum f. sp. fusiforme G11]|uniref:Cytidyltransferase-like domain-containing protein n=1 Tax=Cronartium quercuum f. sp. fusiforme G11 TaxID=708437 RepID=A0A9P6NAI1_9BASI|nr:hypothetical protein CROQUDRAFT_50056 [Cronartium quercuum f. sp. fusiforme G11]